MEVKTLTPTERLVLANQFQILARLSDDKYETDKYQLNADILKRGYTEYYEEVFKDFEDELGTDIREETKAILQMYLHLYAVIDNTKSKLPPEQEEKFRFEGFDNKGKHYEFAKFLHELESSSQENTKNFAFLSKTGIEAKNSITTIVKYRNMLEIYKKELKENWGIQELENFIKKLP